MAIAALQCQIKPVQCFPVMEVMNVDGFGCNCYLLAVTKQVLLSNDCLCPSFIIAIALPRVNAITSIAPSLSVINGSEEGVFASQVSSY